MGTCGLSEVFATDPAREHRYAAIDHGLVQALTGVLEGTGRALVVHGGNSLSRVDLASLPAHGVARVNVGSGVYAETGTEYGPARSMTGSGWPTASRAPSSSATRWWASWS